MRTPACVLAVLVGGCVCVNPDDLELTACSSGADCPHQGDRCCDGFCRAACSANDAGGDAGRPRDDAGFDDAGDPDAGPSDAGAPDSGAEDAGPSDGGPADAGPSDAGADAGARAANGTACSADTDCLSGLCAQSVCCDARCDRGCERCNLPDSPGRCTVADAGAPLCPQGLTCDGTSPDCPIPCGSCPAGTYCLSGFTYCRAQLQAGQSCSDHAQCLSGHCVDGVCCNSACGGGAADCQACSAALGAQQDGTCTLLSATTVCRPATGACDVAELCTGASPGCPPDAKAPAMTQCGAPQLGPCMFDGGFACTGNQVQTSFLCNGGGTCTSSTTLLTATAACAAQRDQLQCAAPAYSACRYAQVCALSGDRDRTDSACSSGACVPHAPVTQTNDPACARSTDGGSCGTGQLCSSGTCRCDPMACTAAFGQYHGCCQADVCVSGNSLSACGGNGAACMPCGSTQCCGASATDPTFACRLVCL